MAQAIHFREERTAACEDKINKNTNGNDPPPPTYPPTTATPPLPQSPNSPFPMVLSSVPPYPQADMILHVGLNARLEATMLNVRIRQRWLRGGLTVGTIGAPVRLTYDHQNLGLTPAALMDIANGTHPFCEAISAAEKPLILFGSAVLEREDAASIVSVLKSLNAQTKVRERAGGGGGEDRNGRCLYYYKDVPISSQIAGRRSCDRQE